MTPEKRVVMFGSLPPLRGISSYCLELARAVSRIAHVTFVTFRALYPRVLYPGGDPEDPSYPLPEEEEFDIRRSLTWYNPVGWLREALRVRADVAHVQHWSLPLVPAWIVILATLRLRGIPTVLTIHNISSHERSLLYPVATRLLGRLANRCIVHCELNRQQAHELLKLPLEKIHTTGMGLLTAGRNRPADRAAARRKLGLPSEAPVILCFGAIRPYKGIGTLIEAFASVAERLPDARLVIAGRPWRNWAPERKRIDRLNLNGRISCFLEYVPITDVQEFFDAADVCVFPYTRFTAQSAAAMTALAFEKPLIVSEVGGLPELVRDRRFAVPPGDPAALADALLPALSNPDERRRMREASAQVAGEHAWEEIAQKTLDAYAFATAGDATAETS